MKPSPKLMQQLNANERILWYGRPLKGPYLMGVAESIIIYCIIISILIYLALTYGHIVNIIASFFGIICTLIFLVLAPHRLMKGARDTEYMVTDQRVFFETISEYAFEGFSRMTDNDLKTVRVLNLEEITDIYIETGFHDIFFGTSTLYVLFKGFQRTTRHHMPEHDTILVHKPPSFSYIMEAQSVKKIIQEAAKRKTVN